MTIEELDIIVEASIKPAMDEIKKLIPEVKKYVGKAVEIAQQSMEKVDMKKVSGKVQQAFQFIRQKIENFKKSSKNNEIAIKVNNKEASKNISQIEKQIDSLEKKINARQLKLDILAPQIEQRKENIIKENLPEGIKVNGNPMDDPFLNKKISEDKELQKMILEANKLKSSIADDTKEVQKLKEELNQTATTQSKLGSFFSALKGKISQIIPTIIGMKSHFNHIPKITQNITNNIKKMTTNVKSGLSHILRYAGALVGIRAVYNLLRNSAQAWLSSQNEGAQQLSANIEYMKYAMGSMFAPVIEYVINLVYQLLKALQSLVYAFSGVNIFAKATASSMKSTAGSAKEASKSLAGVHGEINNISESNGGGGGGSASPNIDLSEMDNTPNALIDAIKNGNWEEIGKTIGMKLNETLEKIPWESIKEKVRNVAKGITDFLNGFIDGANWHLVGGTIAEGLNTAIEFCYTFVTNFKWDKFGKAIGDSINGFFSKLDFKKLAKTLSGRIKGILTVIVEALQNIDWNQIAISIEDFLGNIDYGGILGKALEGIASAIAGLGMIVGQWIVDALEGIEEYFGEYIEECGGNIVEGILMGIGDAIRGIGDWIREHIFEPFIDGFKNVFGIHSPSTVMAEQGKFIIEGLYNGITSLIAKIQEIWINLKNYITSILENLKNTIETIWNNIQAKTQEIWNNIKNFFKNTLENLKNTVSHIFNSIRDTMSNIWNNVVNKVSDVWNIIPNRIREGVQGAWNAITSVFGGIADWFRDKFTQAWQNVKDVFSTGGKIFDGIKEGILNGLKAIINGLIDGINRVIKVPFDGLNSALSSIRGIEIAGIRPFDWLWTIDIPQIPHLAKGNVAFDETFAVFGEYAGASNNPEITAPQNILRETFLEALSDAQFGGSGQQSLTLPIYIGNERIAQILIDDLREMQRETGQSLEVLVGG